MRSDARKREHVHACVCQRCDQPARDAWVEGSTSGWHAGQAAALRELASEIDPSGYGWTSVRDAERFKQRLRKRADRIEAEDDAPEPVTADEVRAEAWDEGWGARDDHDPNGQVFTQEDAAPGMNINPYRDVRRRP